MREENEHEQKNDQIFKMENKQNKISVSENKQKGIETNRNGMCCCYGVGVG